MRGEKEKDTDMFESRMPIIPNQMKKAPPPSIRGNKKIDFSKTFNAPGNKPSLDVIKENNSSFGEEFNLSSSLDQTSPEQTQQFALRTTPTNKFKSPEKTNENEAELLLGNLESEVDSEQLYNSVLEWLLHKTPVSLGGAIIIDDTDKINSISAIYVLMRLYKVTTDIIRERMIHELFMLVKGNPANCASLLALQEFQYFLLDILYDYQLTLFNNELKGIPSAIWEKATRAHTFLMKYALQNDPEGYKRFQNMLIWAENKRNAAKNTPNPMKHEQAATYLVRHLWFNVLDFL
mmetsp:Transcript_11171/g.9546  ORF Transcript_11171/g.9546 Transcript_11171/m.9546 type:complete len:292 (-) Transcript_11171:291-1166(-)